MIPYFFSLRNTPAILRRIVSAVPDARYGETLGEDRFTLLQMVCHLADFEPVFAARMREAVERDMPEFERFDVAQRAIEARYAEQNIVEQLEAFSRHRADTVAFLEGLTEAQLDRELVQAFGRLSIREFVTVLSGHDLYHLDQASAYLDASSKN